MPIIDEKKQNGGRIILAMLKDTGVVACHNDEVVFCFECMFQKHSHKMASFCTLESEDIAKSGKIYLCDECGKEIK